MVRTQIKCPRPLTAVKRAERLLASDSGVSNELRQHVDQWRAELTILERLENSDFAFPRQSRETDAAYSKVFLDSGSISMNYPSRKRASEFGLV